MVRVVRHSKIRIACIAGILRDFFTARREQASRATDIFRFIARESTRRRFTRNASHSLSPGGISLAIACAMSFLAICISMSFFTIRRISSRKYRVTIFQRFVLSSPGSSHSLCDGRGLQGKGEERKSSRFNRINYIHLAKYSRRDVSSTTIECLFPLKRLRRGESTLQESRLDLNAYVERTLVALRIHALVCVLLE